MATVLALLTLALLAAGCSGRGDVPSAWAASGDSYAVFLRWTNDEGELSGQVRLARLDETEVVSTSVGFDGKLSEGDVTLQFRRGALEEFVQQLGGSDVPSTVTGTVSDEALELGLPATGGAVSEVELHPGDVADYNDAVDDLQTQAAEAEQRQQRKRELQGLWASATETLDQALRDAESDISTAEGLVGRARRRLDGSLEETIATLEGQATTAEDEFERDQVAFDLDAVRFEYDAVLSDITEAVSYLSSGVGVELAGTPHGGVAITSVFDGSPAQKAGLEEGTVLVSVNGEHVQGVGQVRRSLQGEPGSELTLRVEDGTSVQELTLERVELGQVVPFDAVREGLRQVRSARDRYTSSPFEPSARASAVISEAQSRLEALVARAEEMHSQAGTIRRKAGQRWDHAVEVAAQAGVQPED